MSAIEELEGARLQRVDGPRPGLLALTLHRPGRTGVLLLSLASPPEWGWVAERPRGEPASAWIGQLRKHLANARVVAARAHAAGATLELARGDGRACLHLVRRPANVILEVDGAVLGAADPAGLGRTGIRRGDPWPEPAAGPPEVACTMEALEAIGERLVDAAASAAADDRRGPLEKALRRHAGKLRRRRDAIEADLDRVAEVAGLRTRADLLLAHLRRIPPGAASVSLADWTTGAPIEIAIAPDRTPREEADALYRRARKIERGAQIALDRHALTEDELERTAALLARAAEAPEDALEEIEREARRLGVAFPTPAGPEATRHERRPYRTFLGLGDRPIHVGRSARDNDALTRGARAWDHWLHARAVRGSHVVVLLDKRERIPDGLLVDAAHLAVHFSSARGEAIVEVQHCPRGSVRKPKGLPVGAVLVEREAVLALRVEPDRLARLLASETTETRTPR